ncbi:MAG: gamma carbonic anhydrase family protein [Candidatus Diapherotrites archaeon]|nr:gamma carbonic anhydrase family protein [Candidatus Diapherotrites archaeon]
MISEFESKKPKIAKNVFVAENSTVLGQVEIGENSSVWFGAVLRADINSIKIGKNTSIQDNSVLHVASRHSVEIGNQVIVGHNVIVHGAKIGNNTMIGMGSILLNGAEVGDNCIIGAGAVVTEGMKIPNNSIAVGMPAKVIKQVSEEHLKRIEGNWKEYVELNERFLKWKKN